MVKNSRRDTIVRLLGRGEQRSGPSASFTALHALRMIPGRAREGSRLASCDGRTGCTDPPRSRTARAAAIMDGMRSAMRAMRGSVLSPRTQRR